MKKEIVNIIIRYLLIILLGLGNLWVIYLIFSPLTFYTVLFILNLFSKTYVSASTMYSSEFIIELVKPCIAGAAYYFLIILNLSTPMPLKDRINSFLSTICIFFLLNIGRIILFTFLYAKDFAYTDIFHKLTWYFGSTVLLLIIWFSN